MAGPTSVQWRGEGSGRVSTAGMCVLCGLVKVKHSGDSVVLNGLLMNISLLASFPFLCTASILLQHSLPLQHIVNVNFIQGEVASPMNLSLFARDSLIVLATFVCRHTLCLFPCVCIHTVHRLHICTHTHRHVCTLVISPIASHTFLDACLEDRHTHGHTPNQQIQHSDNLPL